MGKENIGLDAEFYAKFDVLLKKSKLHFVSLRLNTLYVSKYFRNAYRRKYNFYLKHCYTK